MSKHTIPSSASIDLQMHTRFSDGAWEAVELISWLAGHQFRIAAITDHDSVVHLPEIQSAGRALGVTMLSAVELTTSWEGMRADILCYASQFTSDALARVAARTEHLQFENTQQVYEALLKRGYEFPRRADVLAAQGGQVVRPIDNAVLIHAHGYVESLRDGVALMRDMGYVSIATPTEEAVAAAHASGAVALIAHPGRNGGEISRFDPDVLERLVDAVGLDGLEARYPTHSEAQVAAYLALAERRGLLVSAGSDSHSPTQRLPIAYPAFTCAALLERCDITIE